MTPEITFQMAIIWKVIATLLFILVAKGLFDRIFKFKLTHWLVFVIGIVALFAAIRMDLVGKFISSLKKKETKYITIEKKVQQPIITPTVGIVEIPTEYNSEPPVYKPEVTQSTVIDKNYRDSVFYVNAWVDDKGKQKYGTGDDVVYTPAGYVDRFDPLEDVYGLPDPGSNKEPFEDGPDMQVTVRWDFKSVAFGSRCGHNTKVKVTRRWIGAKWNGSV